MSTLLLKHADLLVTMDTTRRKIADGGLFIRDNQIIQVGPTAELPATADTVLDARGMIVLPGLVNTHHHLYQTLTRCIAQDSVLFDWLETLYPIWARLTPEAVTVSAMVGLAELMLSGCTTSSDHLYIYPNGCKIEHEIEAAVELGIRFTATRGGMSLGRSQGGLPPDNCVESEAAILKDSQRAVEMYHQRERFGMVQVALAPCSPFSVTGDLMRESAALARSLRRPPAHPPGRDDGRGRVLPGEVRRAAGGLRRLARLDRRRRVARALRLSERGGDRALRAHRQRRGALSQLEHAPGLGHRADPRHARRGGEGRPGRGRLGLQRW